MGRLQDREAVGCPELVEGRISFEGGEGVASAMAVGEEDDRESVPGGGEGCSEFEVDWTVWGWDHDWAEGDDWFGVIDGQLGRNSDEGVMSGMHDVGVGIYYREQQKTRY